MRGSSTRAPRALSQLGADRVLGDRLVVWIDPRSLSRSVPRLEKHLAAVVGRRISPLRHVSPRLIPRIRPLLPFVLGQDWYPVPKDLAANRSMALMANLVEHRSDPERSDWWLTHRSAIDTYGSTTVKGRRVTDEHALRAHLDDYLLPLVAGLEARGWDREVPGSIPGAASIGADGELLKAESVNHRFFLARALGTSEFPLRVRSVHRNWWNNAIANSTTRRSWVETVEAALHDIESRHRAFGA